MLTFSNRSTNLERIAFVARRTNARCAMDSHLTNRIHAALVLIHARIFTFLRDTGQRCRTVRVDGTLGPALGVRITLQAKRTCTLAHVADWAGDGIDAARVGVARVNNNRLGRRRPDAFNQCVTGEPGQTRAHWRVTFNLTLGIASTHTGTWVVAVEVAAGHVRWTVGVDDTLGFAFNIRVALVFRRARAYTFVANFCGNCAVAAWIGHTRVGYHWFG